MNYSIRNLFLLMIMIVASVLAMAIKPTEKMADYGSKINLESLIPKQFGEWRVDETVTSGIINPEVTNLLNKTYSQTLSQTYINKYGKRVMLSIAYGGNQSREFQVHRPETCYASQGFRIEAMEKGILNTTTGNIPVMRMIANQGGRHEPITYWVKIGQKLLRGNLEQGFARLEYGLQGKIPDGLLFRVSSLSDDREGAYRLQGEFVNELLSAVAPSEKNKLIGSL